MLKNRWRKPYDCYINIIIQKPCETTKNYAPKILITNNKLIEKPNYFITNHKRLQTNNFLPSSEAKLRDDYGTNLHQSKSSWCKSIADSKNRRRHFQPDPIQLTRLRAIFLFILRFLFIDLNHPAVPSPGAFNIYWFYYTQWHTLDWWGRSFYGLFAVSFLLDNKLFWNKFGK